MESHKIIQVEEKVPLKLLLPLSIQHMFAMFGASVLVPFIFGINPAIVLFMNGVGTLLFIVVTKAKSPAYLGSSFAFLAPAGVVISKMGYPYALGGFVAVGFCGCILSFIIYKCGTKWIDIVLPPAAMGPVVALIGLELSSSAASNAGLLEDKIDPKNVLVFAVTLGGCGIWKYFIQRIFISYPDPDRSSRRISDSVGMRNPGFYTGSRSFMVCNPEFSGAKVRYGCNPYDPSGTVGYHIRAYRTSGCNKQNYRKRFVNRPGTSQIPVRG